jgi:hypothetical protein
MEHEVESLTRGTPLEARAEEHRLMEDGGDDEPTAAPWLTEPDEEEGSPALSRGEVHARSELARHLRGSIFPAGRDEVIACAVEEHAPPRMVEALRALPDGEYRNVEGVWEALGGRRDERSPEGDVEDPVGAAEPRAVIPDPPAPGPAPMPPEPPPVPEPPMPEPAPIPEPEPLPPPGQPPIGRARSVATTLHRFGFRFATPFRLAAMPFLVNPANAWVTVDTRDRLLTARYGPWCVETSLDNIDHVDVTGPYSWLKTIGPPHVSLADRGLTFASNRDLGVCIGFVEAVRGVDALGVVRHPALTVTVEDVDELVSVLEGSIAAT